MEIKIERFYISENYIYVVSTDDNLVLTIYTGTYLSLG